MILYAFISSIRHHKRLTNPEMLVKVKIPIYLAVLKFGIIYRHLYRSALLIEVLTLGFWGAWVGVGGGGGVGWGGGWGGDKLDNSEVNLK